MPPDGTIVDLFAGAGGWDEGLRLLGHHALGIELDETACATARAAGHERLTADLAALDPAAFAPVWGLIGSPPCQAYSTAGRGLGRLDKPRVITCAHELAAGHDSRAARLARCVDPRSLLTVEPLRWAVALRPRWVALEQVPPVLELWTIFADLLSAHGYETAVGVLSAERYGVPQTRKRAFLVASLDGPVRLPAPTHRSYDPRRPDHVREEERQLRPWVSMGDALGWRGAGVTHTNNQTCGGRRPRGHARGMARTVDSCSGAWTMERPHVRSGRRVAFDPRTTNARPRPTDAPAHTITGLGCPAWVAERGSPRRSRGQSCAAVRVSPRQAAVLQGFRADYPWQGGRGRQFLQIGNAVCPPLARHVLAEAMRPTLEAGR